MSLNKVQLIGNVGVEPSLKTFDNGGCICNITIATTKRGYTTKDGREIKEKTEWHNVVFKNQLAKVASQYLRKGDKVFVEGELTYRSYEKDGQRKMITEVVVTNLEFMKMGNRTASEPQEPQPQLQSSTNQSQQTNTAIDDDWIPFLF